MGSFPITVLVVSIAASCVVSSHSVANSDTDRQQNANNGVLEWLKRDTDLESLSEDQPNDEASGSNEDNESLCVICHDGFGEKSGWRLKCGHQYHRICIKRCSGSGIKKCPLCRGPLELADGTFVEDLLYPVELIRTRLERAYGTVLSGAFRISARNRKKFKRPGMINPQDFG